MKKYRYYIAYMTESGHGNAVVTTSVKLNTEDSIRKIAKELSERQGSNVNIINIVRLK